MIYRANGCGVLPLLILFVIGLGGCGAKSSFEMAPARERLAAVLEIQPEATVDVLMHRQTEPEDTELWVLLSDRLLGPLVSNPSTAHRSRSTADRMPESKFPASALFSFAATFGVSHEVMNAPAADEGIAREWAIDGRNVRLRSVETEVGFLSVLEILP